MNHDVTLNWTAIIFLTTLYMLLKLLPEKLLILHGNHCLWSYHPWHYRPYYLRFPHSNDKTIHFQSSLHPVQGHRELESIPAVILEEENYTMSQSSAHYNVNTET